MLSKDKGSEASTKARKSYQGAISLRNHRTEYEEQRKNEEEKGARAERRFTLAGDYFLLF